MEKSAEFAEQNNINCIMRTDRNNQESVDAAFMKMASFIKRRLGFSDEVAKNPKLMQDLENSKPIYWMEYRSVL